MLLAAMFAGHHTSSVTTAWTLHRAGCAPRLPRQRARRARCGVQPGNATSTFQSLREIPLTENAVKESLRLHPPLFILCASALVDFVYKRLSAAQRHLDRARRPGSRTACRASSRTPSASIPTASRPARGGQAHFAFIAFGGGRHKCLGNAFAILQVKTIFAILLRGYEFEVLADPIIPESGLVMGPKKPFRVRYRRLRPNGKF